MEKKKPKKKKIKEESRGIMGFIKGVKQLASGKERAHPTAPPKDLYKYYPSDEGFADSLIQKGK